MSKKRTIDPEIFYDTELVSALRARGLHLYIQLWCIAEDWGGYIPDYPSIALKMGALRFSAKEVEKSCNILIEKKKVIPYVADNGREIHWLKNFLKYQHLTNSALPVNPLPPWISCKIKKFPSNRKYAIYTVASNIIPVGYMYTTCSLPVIEKLEETKETILKETKEGGMGEIKNPENPLFSMDGKEKKEFLFNKTHLINQCEVLVQAFKDRKDGKGFDPIRFLINAVKVKIPVAIYKKVIDSMVKQKDKIQDPEAWAFAVLKREKQGHHYAEALKKHYEIKNMPIKGIIN